MSWGALQRAGACHGVLEPTSTFHHRLVQTLVDADISSTAVNPARTAGYAGDARLLARYGDREKPHPSHPPDEAQERLKALRRHLEGLPGRPPGRPHPPGRCPTLALDPSRCHPQPEQGIRQREAEVAQAQAEADAAVAQNQRWTHPVELLTTIPGVGQRTVVLVVSELPPVERCAGPKQWVAFCGVNPEPRESGTSRYSRLSRRGSPQVRAGLYMAAVAAMRCNPSVHALCQRLQAKGKSGRVRVMAAMNKLLHLCFGVLRSGKPFDPALHQPITP